MNAAVAKSIRRNSEKEGKRGRARNKAIAGQFAARGGGGGGGGGKRG